VDGVRPANPFGSILGLLLQPNKPLTGIARTSAAAAALQAQALAAAAAAPAEGRPPEPQAAPRGEGLLGRLVADAVDPDGGGRRGGRDGRADPVEPVGEGGAAPEAAAPAEDAFVPGVAAMLGLERQADIVVDRIRVAEQHLASEAPEDAPSPPPGRDALPVGAYARAQRAVADEPADGPVIDEAAAVRAAGAPAPSLSDAVLSFGMAVSEADLRIVRRGADLVISVAGSSEALVLRGAAVRGAPTLAFADGARIEGAELLARARPPETPRAAAGGLPDGGLMA